MSSFFLEIAPVLSSYRHPYNCLVVIGRSLKIKRAGISLTVFKRVFIPIIPSSLSLAPGSRYILWRFKAMSIFSQVEFSLFLSPLAKGSQITRLILRLYRFFFLIMLSPILEPSPLTLSSKHPYLNPFSDVAK